MENKVSIFANYSKLIVIKSSWGRKWGWNRIEGKRINAQLIQKFQFINLNIIQFKLSNLSISKSICNNLSI
ncbi:hypothetical protein CHU00_18520 [Sphingobacterium cellulitidis]|nr:hypothetical protein CHU00_18520 [Sphingobacterium cellulitidis]